MKLKGKHLVLILLYALIVVTLLMMVYRYHHERATLNQEKEQLLAAALTSANALNQLLHKEIDAAVHLSGSEPLIQALQKSNHHFSALTPDHLKAEILDLNQQWSGIELSTAPLLLSVLKNPAAQWLKKQQQLNPDHYGEIFLTNRFGALVASTGKLTTYAHGYKYWWKAAYDHGVGKAFLDDRGYDTSVNGAVLGAVVPVMDGDEVIGILKCNINIHAALSGIDKQLEDKLIRVAVVRSAGVIVYEPGFETLSSHLEPAARRLLKRDSVTSGFADIHGRSMLMAQAPLTISTGSENVGFGGKPNSVDHNQGNKNEAWHLLVYKHLSDTQTSNK